MDFLRKVRDEILKTAHEAVNLFFIGIFIGAGIYVGICAAIQIFGVLK